MKFSLIVAGPLVNIMPYKRVTTSAPVFKDIPNPRKFVEEYILCNGNEQQKAVLKKLSGDEGWFISQYKKQRYKTIISAYLNAIEYNHKVGRFFRPDARFDYYAIPGRYQDFFITTSGKKTYTAKKRNIDFKAMEERDVTKALEKWRQFEKAIGHIPKLDLTLDEAFYQYNNLDYNEIMNIYESQPALELIKNTKQKYPNLPNLNIEYLQIGLKQYLKRARLLSYTPHALFYNGRFFEQGRMTEHGVVPKHQNIVWASLFRHHLSQIADDQILTIIEAVYTGD